MALYKDHHITLDLKRTPKIALQNIVAGETGNRLIITLTNDDDPVTLNSSIYRVALRVASDLGVRRQDSSLANSGISFTDGNAVILLSKDSYTAGTNIALLEVYSTETESYDTLVDSAAFRFYASGTGTGENAGSAYPSLMKAENDAVAAAAAATAAAAAIDMCLSLTITGTEADEATATLQNVSLLTSIVNGVIAGTTQAKDLRYMTCMFAEPFHGGDYVGSTAFARLRRYKITDANNYTFEFGDDTNQHTTVLIYKHSGSLSVILHKGW